LPPSESIRSRNRFGKALFQLHDADARGVGVLRKQLTRARLLGFPAKFLLCLVRMEACATAHYRGRAPAAGAGAMGLRPTVLRHTCYFRYCTRNVR